MRYSLGILYFPTSHMAIPDLGTPAFFFTLCCLRLTVPVASGYTLTSHVSCCLFYLHLAWTQHLFSQLLVCPCFKLYL